MKTQVVQRFNDLKKNVSIQLNNPSNFKAAMNAFAVAMFLFVFALVLIPTGFAENYAEDIKNIAFNVYKAIAGISTALAAVGETIAACMYFFSSNGRTVEAASGWMKRIALGWVFINAMGIAVSFITSVVGSSYQWQGN